ncbi:hypothetical protein U1Q18_021739 [Sarracenia purpurea var. burkii]
MEQKSHLPKWEFKVSARLRQSTPDQTWLLFKDFFNLHKWFPTLPICYGIHGANGELGCIRYCAGFALQSRGNGGNVNGDNNSAGWSMERLIGVDPVDRIISYEMVDSNIGFKSYISTVKIIPGAGDGHDEGCMIEWLLTVDPVEGWRLEDLVKKYESGLQGMAKKMEDALGRSEQEE